MLQEEHLQRLSAVKAFKEPFVNNCGPLMTDMKQETKSTSNGWIVQKGPVVIFGKDGVVIFVRR